MILWSIEYHNDSKDLKVTFKEYLKDFKKHSVKRNCFLKWKSIFPFIFTSLQVNAVLYLVQISAIYVSLLIHWTKNIFPHLLNQINMWK